MFTIVYVGGLMSIEQLSKDIQDELKKKYNFHVPVDMIKNKLKMLILIHNFDERSAKETVIKQYEDTLIKNQTLLKRDERKPNEKEREQPKVSINIKSEIQGLLHQMFGDEARFRPHQCEAIEAIVRDRKKLLVVQRTGWGKSVVYFIATKMLRKEGFGPTLIISPLLSLMRNQMIMAKRLGLKAFTLNSGNRDLWDDIIDSVKRDECDLILISPERLSKEWFENNILNNMKSGPGMFVVDEAHCISDWGHDFRPDYKRIVNIVKSLTPRTPMLATTATANKRVVDDIVEQLGRDLLVIRGPLIRENLHLMNIHLASKELRLAWLVENIPRLDHAGIIYCLTKDDCETVSRFLELKGISSRFYHADLNSRERERLENALINNEVKALVSTIALGMGFDKPDLGFVIHYQMPPSLLAYYQQVGRAGRGIDKAYAIMLYGDRDSTIINNLIKKSFPNINKMIRVAEYLDKAESSKTITQISEDIDLRESEVSACIKHLAVEGAVYEDNTNYGRYIRSTNNWAPDETRHKKIITLKYNEKKEVKDYIDYSGCLMEFICKHLDDEYESKCNICANCNGPFLPKAPDPALVKMARQYLSEKYVVIQPHRQWANGVIIDGHIDIPAYLVNEYGLAMCQYGDDTYGNLIEDGKYKYNYFPYAIVESVSDMVLNFLDPLPENIWITCVPSKRRKDLMNSFAIELGKILNRPYKPIIEKVQDTVAQKDRNNSKVQLINIKDAFEVSNSMPGPVLLIDDIVDSGWTMAVCGYKLRKAGSGPVFPIAIASSSPRGK